MFVSRVVITECPTIERIGVGSGRQEGGLWKKQRCEHPLSLSFTVVRHNKVQGKQVHRPPLAR